MGAAEWMHVIPLFITQAESKNKNDSKHHILNVTPETNPSFLVPIPATILPLRHIWSRTVGPGRAQHTPGWAYSRLRRWCCCCSWPWSGWNTCRRLWSAAAWSSGPAGASFVAAGQSVQKPRSWYIQASSQIFVSRWLPSDSNSTARYPSEIEKSPDRGGEREKVFRVFFWMPETVFVCWLTPWLITKRDFFLRPLIKV